MERRKGFRITVAALVLLSLGALQSFAQEENTAPPKAAARTVPLIPDTAGNQDQDSTSTQSDALEPDTRTLTGIQTPTLGSQEYRHSYWVPGFQYGNTIQSMSLVGVGPVQGWSSDNYFAGNLSLLSTWSRAQLAVNYSGGGFVSTDKGLGDGYFHELGIIQEFNWGRWKLDFLDQFSYLPEALFGFSGPIRLGVPGISTSLAPPSPDLVTNLVPSQSILASVGTRYTNASAAQVDYALSSRSSITLAGSYGFLRFEDPGNIDSDQVSANVGYNYLLTRRDTIGVLYRFTGFHYDGLSQALGDHVVSLAYGRKITGRLALALSGGPEIVSFRVPVSGVTNQVLPYGTASMIYGVPQGQFSLAYTHGVSAGSGILVGSDADQLTVGGNRRLGRSWTLLGSLGYSRNHTLAATPAGLASTFYSWVASAGLTYPFGPNANMSLGYTARIQTSSLTCVGVCASNYTQHQISLGFPWNTRPFVIR